MNMDDENNQQGKFMKNDILTITIKGITPLIMHSPRAANFLDPKVKQFKGLSNKRQKSDQEREELLQLQWELGLYWDNDLGLYIPSEMITAAILHAAKVHKLGKKTIGILTTHPIGYPLITENSKNLNKLTEDTQNKFIKDVVIQKSRILANRPIFHQWKLTFDLEIDREILNIDDLTNIIFTMSQKGGLGVWRPSSPKPGTYGRFIVESMTICDGKTNKTKTIV